MSAPDIFVPEPVWKDLPIEVQRDGRKVRVWKRTDAEYHFDCRRFAWKLHEHAEELSMKYWGMLCIPRGGLVGAGYIARELNIRLVETLCCKLYDDTKLSGKQVRVLLPINPHFLEMAREYGRGLLVFDDIVDSGQTAQAIRRHIGGSLRSDQYCLATPYAKQGAENQVDKYLTYIPDVPDETGQGIDPKIWVRHPWDLDYQHTNALVGAEGN